MIRRPPRSTLSSSSAASDVYKRQVSTQSTGTARGGMAGCAHCGAPSPTVPCPQCKTATYCNKQCYKAHKKHKKSGECARQANAQAREAGSLLLTEGGGMSSRFRAVLAMMFERFDLDGDGHLNESELLRYSGSVNRDGRVFDSSEMDQIRSCFEWSPEHNGLTLNGWMDMYFNQTSSDPDETWADLEQLGYNRQLELFETPGQ
eukprot:TRINITY_DN20974_c0_g1_i1.p1 TRINITY_DN20974_c0_g1~~TRINITY_DN20974_c0_g1_i1.p1  ORF type:complete len:204 (+),score=35.56 TRINITY_DN20974_c0_g1_i1:106-717(+)